MTKGKLLCVLVFGIVGTFFLYCGCNDDSSSESGTGDLDADGDSDSDGDSDVDGDSDSGEDIQANCAEAETLLRECEILSQGDVSCGQLDLSSCELDCVRTASCAEISQAFCEQNAPDEMDQCFGACPNTDFVCDDGNNVGQLEVCDGFNDCPGGEDEQECGTGVVEVFQCDDGDTISYLRECDFELDCADGSDEHDGCAVPQC